MTTRQVALLLAYLCLLTGCQRDNPPQSMQAPARDESPSPAVPAHVSAKQQEAPPPARSVPLDMVKVPGSEFFMGVPEDEAVATSKGSLTSAPAFLMDRLEVSVEEYMKCRSAGACKEPLSEGGHCNATAEEARPQHPMNCVSWKEAETFCVSRGKRLPSSVEWELAARGTDKRPYPWGTAVPKDQLCWRGAKKRAKTTTCPVGSHPEAASPFGVQDMAGNVAEWTSTSVTSPGRPPLRDTRGGSYLFEAADYATNPNWTEVRVDRAAPTNPVERELNDVNYSCSLASTISAAGGRVAHLW